MNNHFNNKFKDLKVFKFIIINDRFKNFHNKFLRVIKILMNFNYT